MIIVDNVRNENVILTEEEIEKCYVGAIYRVSESQHLFKRIKTTLDEQMEIDFEACAAEFAVAKYFQIEDNFELTVNTFKLPDVANVQVRSTKYHSGRLILHDRDSDTEIFIFVTGTAAEGFILRGWIQGHEAKYKTFLDDYKNVNPAYFVPQCMLHPMYLLDVDLNGKIFSTKYFE